VIKKKARAKPVRIFVTDSIADKEEIEVCRDYGGILFVNHFCLSKDDALKLRDYISEQYKPKRKKASKR
jgi:hypothetical protein